MSAEEMNYPCPFKSEESIELLLDYTAHKLDPHKAAVLERHMASCEECAEFREDQATVWKALDAWDAPPVSMDFNRRLWQRIAEEKAAPWYSKAGLRNLAGSMRLPSWKPALSIAAGVLLVTAGFVFDHPLGRQDFNRTSPGVSPENRVTVSEAEQVERTLDDIQLLHQFDAIASDSEPASQKM